MNYLDFIILFVLLFAFLLGYKDGFVRKLVGTAGFIFGIYLSFTLSDEVGNFIFSITGIELYLARILAGIAIFVATIFFTSIIIRIFNPFDRINNLINRLIGGFVGVLQFIIFLSALLYILNIFKFPSQNDKDSSMFYHKVHNVLPDIIEYLDQYTPGANNIFKQDDVPEDSLL